MKLLKVFYVKFVLIRNRCETDIVFEAIDTLDRLSCLIFAARKFSSCLELSRPNSFLILEHKKMLSLRRYSKLKCSVSVFVHFQVYKIFSKILSGQL